MMFRAAGAEKFFGRKPPTGKVDTAKSSKYVVFFIPYYSQLSLNRHLYSKNWLITPYKNGHQEWHWQNPASVCFVTLVCKTCIKQSTFIKQSVGHSQGLLQVYQ